MVTDRTEWYRRLDDLISNGPTRLERLAPLREAVRSRPLVLFGAGSLGRVGLAGLRGAGVEPRCFADNDPKLHGKTIDRLKVLSPTAALEEIGSDAVFVVTVYTSAQLRKDLAARGFFVVPFAVAALEFGTPALPHAGLDFPEKVYAEIELVRAAMDLWADETSREEYLAQIRYRLTLEDDLPPPLSAADTYFPSELVRLVPDEVFVDCGAFDGDSLRAFLARVGNSFAGAVPIEADPGTGDRLAAFVASLPPELSSKIRVEKTAVGEKRGTVTFEATGTAASNVTASGSVSIPVAPLDAILADDRPTYIKMDIEGAEPDALRGAAGVIAKHRPVLAICLYHRQNDLWRIPLLIRELGPDYELFLRRYSDDCWEQVVYAIPRNRVAK